MLHQHDVGNEGIDFVLFQVILTVSEMVSTVALQKNKAKRKLGMKSQIQTKRKRMRLKSKSVKLQQTVFNSRKSATR